MRNPKKQNLTPKQNIYQVPELNNDRLSNHRMTRESKLIDQTVESIPPVFPYEGGAMLFEELNNNHRGDKDMRAVPRKMETTLESQIF